MENKKRILIIDDEEGIRESMRLILSERYELIFAGNALQAVDEVKRYKPDLVLLDIKMPKVSGLSLLKDIKAKFKTQKVIIVTGYQSVEMAQEAIRLGATDYLPKPFGTKELLPVVKRALGE